jgi:hypothetical protein
MGAAQPRAQRARFAGAERNEAPEFFAHVFAASGAPEAHPSGKKVGGLRPR